MRIVFLLLLGLAGTAHGLEVITLNAGLICIGPGCLLASSDDLSGRARAVGAWIKQAKPDVVFLQEVFREREFKAILAESEMPYGIYAHPRSALAVLSRFPLSKPTFHPLRWQASIPADCKRLAVRVLIGVATAVMTTPDGSEIRLVNTHTLPRRHGLKGFSEPADVLTPERKVNILELRELLGSADPKQPLVFGGDFNMNQLSEEYAYFARVTGLQDVMRTHVESKPGVDWKNLCTFCEENPSVKAQGIPGERVLDYLWVIPGTFRIVDARIRSETDAFSDHRAVSATLELSTSAAWAPPKESPELEALTSHLRSVSIHPFCRLAVPWGWTERADALTFLGKLR